MLIHRQNSYAPRTKRSTGRREAQTRETGQQSKNPPCIYRLKPIINFDQGIIPMCKSLRTLKLKHTDLVSFFFLHFYSELYTTHKHVQLENTET
jgi:hypothetical protein